MTGPLKINKGSSWSQIQFGDGSNVSNHKIHGNSSETVSQVLIEANVDGTNDNRTLLSISSYLDRSLANVIGLGIFVDGTSNWYYMYGTHNITKGTSDLTAGIDALTTNSIYLVYE